MTPPSRDQRPTRSLFVLLLLACFTLITLDVRGGEDSPVDPLRSAVGDVFGPVETAAASVMRPVVAVPGFFRSTGRLRAEVAALEAENSVLRGELATSSVARQRAAELDAMLATSDRSGHALVPARVVAMGPAQSFSRTVTIDAGTDAGVTPDLTVLNNDGLVGRVIRADRTTATVLLIVDRDSVVGGRLGSNLEIGFLRGQGEAGDAGRLHLELVDGGASAARDDVLVTWGSRSGAPYVAGVPIGAVTAVTSDPGQLSRQATIRPFVDFTALDLVGVVVAPGTRSDRTLIQAGAPETGGRP